VQHTTRKFESIKRNQLHLSTRLHACATWVINYLQATAAV